jgi:PAS domain S-box-containing protein
MPDNLRNNPNIPAYLQKVFDELGNVDVLHKQIEENPQAILITNAKGKIIYANCKMIELSGYEANEIIGNNPSLFKSGEQPESFYDRLWGSIRNGKKFESRFKNKKKNGELYWVYSVISPLLNENGEISGFISIQEEITNLVKFENESSDSDEVLINLVKSLPNTGIFVIGNNPHEIIQAKGEIVQEFFSDKAPTFDDLVRDFKHYGFNVKEEISTFCVNGSSRRKRLTVGDRTIDFNISPVHFSNSSDSYCLLVIRDVTYYQKIIEQVQNSEKQLEAIFQNAGVGIAILDVTGKYLRTNNGWSELIGYSKNEILNSTVHNYIHPEDLNLLRPQLHQVLKGVINSLRIEARAIRKDKSIRWGDINITSIRGKNSEVTAVIAVFVDITENKEYREQLEKSEKEYKELNATKDKFFSIISHDLKNPFNNIIGLTDLALDDPDDISQEGLLEYMKTINASASQAYALLQNLLDWSRAQTGAISPVLVHHDLYDIVSNAINNVVFMANSKNIVIENYIDPDQWVICDYDMMFTVLRNLLTNAIKFSHKNSKVEILIEEHEQYKVLSVRDYGMGISDEQKVKLFDIASNSSQPGTNNEKGTGLGLILVNDFVKLNNGELSFESIQGEGTTFKVSLPNLAF